MDENFLIKYLNGNSPVGLEYEIGGQKIWMDHLLKITGNVDMDDYGTAYSVIGNKDSDFKVIIEAHCDEVSWLVSSINSNGYINVIKNGGSDPTIAPSMRVILWGEKGPINGVFGHPPIHKKDRSEKSDIKSIFIDVGGSSKKDVISMGINIGTVVTFDAKFMKLGNDYYSGKSLDNKIGGFIISEVAKMIVDNNIKLPYKLYIVNSVQEETGLNGSKMISGKIKPNIAIVTDVCQETSSPCYIKNKQVDLTCGQGPVITRSPAVHNKLRNIVIKTSNDEKIPIQLSASSSTTGTDTESFAFSNNGVPSVLISIPLKYMHTTVETCHKLDVENAIKLMYNTLLNIEENHNMKYNSN